MFFWISKITEFLFSPLTWIIAAMLISLLTKKTRRKRLWLILTICMTFVFTNSFLATEAIRLWEIHEPTMKEDTKYDVTIVLGGGMITYDSSNERYSFRSNTDRIFQALLLFEQGRTERILISGGSGSMVYRNMSEACLLREYCGQLGYDTSRIWAECESDNTYQNAVNTYQILQDSISDGNFLLVTSAHHMRRAQAVFKKTGLKFDILPTNPIAGKRRYDPYFLLVPQTNALRTWDKFFKECFGYVIYKFSGYL